MRQSANNSGHVQLNWEIFVQASVKAYIGNEIKDLAEISFEAKLSVDNIAPFCKEQCNSVVV